MTDEIWTRPVQAEPDWVKDPFRARIWELRDPRLYKTIWDDGSTFWDIFATQWDKVFFIYEIWERPQ